MDATTIYWITRLDGINGALGVLGAVLAITGGIGVVLRLASWMDSDEFGVAPRGFTALVVAVACGALVVNTARILTPTTKEMAAILVLPAIANSEDAQEIGAGLVDLAKEWLVELKPNSEESK